MFENPCGLLEQSTRFLGTITSEVHVACLSHAGYSEVVQRRVHLDEGHGGLLLFLGEAIIPDKLKVDIGLKNKNESLIELLNTLRYLTLSLPNVTYLWMTEKFL